MSIEKAATTTGISMSRFLEQQILDDRQASGGADGVDKRYQLSSQPILVLDWRCVRTCRSKIGKLLQG